MQAGGEHTRESAHAYRQPGKKGTPKEREAMKVKGKSHPPSGGNARSPFMPDALERKARWRYGEPAATKENPQVIL